MSASSYQRIVRVLERWPLDPTKSGRDLGQQLRNSFKESFEKGEFSAHAQFWDRQYFALQRLVNGEHQKKYPRSSNTTATGLSVDICRIIVSTEGLKLIQEDSKPFYKKWFRSKQ